MEEEQTPHHKKGGEKKKTIPDIFCDYVLFFQRQVEQLIQRRHGCDETERDTEIEGRERREAKKLFSLAGEGKQRKQQTQRRNQTTARTTLVVQPLIKTTSGQKIICP